MIPGENSQKHPIRMASLADSGSDLHVILHSVSLLLAEVIGCKFVALLVPNKDGESARLHLLRLDVDLSTFPIVRDVPIDDAALAGLINGG